MANEYQKKLNHRKWQIKRLRIFERDNFTCQLCETEKDQQEVDEESEQLHCHHKYYNYKTDPWDYPDEALITYCSGCHTNIEILLKSIKHLNWPLHSHVMSDYCHSIILLGEVIHQGKIGMNEIIENIKLMDFRHARVDKNS